MKLGNKEPVVDCGREAKNAGMSRASDIPPSPGGTIAAPRAAGKSGPSQGPAQGA